MKSRRSKACDIPKAVKIAVHERDGGCCIFCGVPVGIECSNAHYIPRSDCGLGIAENVGTLCPVCHNRQHHSPDGHVVFEKLRDYLHRLYPGFTDQERHYRKGIV